MSFATEHQEQTALFTWARVMQGLYPELALMYAIPNAAKRSKSLSAMMKAEGLKSGVPDICLPCARREYHGLYIELKRTKGGKVSPQQKEWLTALNKEGYMAVVCEGFEEAKAVIEKYLAEEILNTDRVTTSLNTEGVE